MTLPSKLGEALVLTLLLLGSADAAHAFLGVADTSFVTVIANPAEAANWASELERMNDQLSAARDTLQTVSDMRTFAGNPASAAAAARDLQAISGAVGALSSDPQTGGDLQRAWQVLGTAQQASNTAALLQGAGAGSTMQVFGQTQPRNQSLYAGFAEGMDEAGQVRSQIAGEQAARASVASELASAWSQFRSATTESQKQTILAEISQLQAQNQVLDTRRKAILDDLELSDRQALARSSVQSKAADEGLLAESALLNADAASRVQQAQAQRMATLQKAPSPPASPDYSGLKLWTTADADGGSN